MYTPTSKSAQAQRKAEKHANLNQPQSMGEEQIMICLNCGEETEGNAEFCMHCGQRLPLNLYRETVDPTLRLTVMRLVLRAELPKIRDVFGPGSEAVTVLSRVILDLGKIYEWFMDDAEEP